MTAQRCPIAGPHSHGMHRLGRAYLAAERRALRRFRLPPDPVTGRGHWNLYAQAETLTDNLARAIAAQHWTGTLAHPDATARSVSPTIAHRAARLALGLED